MLGKLGQGPVEGSAIGRKQVQSFYLSNVFTDWYDNYLNLMMQQPFAVTRCKGVLRAPAQPPPTTKKATRQRWLGFLAMQRCMPASYGRYPQVRNRLHYQDNVLIYGLDSSLEGCYIVRNHGRNAC